MSKKMTPAPFSHRVPSIVSVIALAVAVIALVFALSALDADGAQAHSGGLAADGCHKDNAAGERHWHRDGTRDRGGECVKHGEDTYRYLAAPAPEPTKQCTALKARFELATTDWAFAPAWSEEERNASIRAVDAGCP